MMQNELVSIIIPVYQAEQFLKRSVFSALAQTYRPIEILLVDDGSTDHSGVICDFYEKKHPEIKVFHRKHGGVCAARNHGILHADGKYIYFLDADDEMLPDMIESLVKAIQKEDAYMAACGYETLKQTTAGYETHTTNWQVSGCLEKGDVLEIMESDLLSVTWNKLYIKDRIVHLYDETMILCEDSVFCTDYFMHNPKIAVCPQILYRYDTKQSSLHNVRVFRYQDVKKYYLLNCRLVKFITNDKKRKAARYHAARVFFYGVYTYIFERLPQADISSREKKVILRQILWDRIYVKTVSKLRKLYFKEACYKAASMLKSERLLYLMLRCRNRLKEK